MKSLEEQLRVLIRKQKQYYKAGKTKDKQPSPSPSLRQSSLPKVQPNHEIEQLNMQLRRCYEEIKKKDKLIQVGERRGRQMEYEIEALKKQNGLYCQKIIELQGTINNSVNQNRSIIQKSEEQGEAELNGGVQIQPSASQDESKSGGQSRTINPEIQSRQLKYSSNKKSSNGDEQPLLSSTPPKEKRHTNPLPSQLFQSKHSSRQSEVKPLEVEETAGNAPMRRRFYHTRFKFRDYHY